MDIDLDFADRDKIISYLMQKYGNDRVCQIINFSYITPVVAIKDVARVLGIPYFVSDKISKKFVYETFEECVSNNPNLLEEYVEYRELFDVASKISGRVRNASIHAGGVGIVDTKITDYMAMKVGSKGERVIQVDKKKVEEIGIIKFDILGVATLGVVQEVMREVGLTPWDLNINNPRFANDEKTFKLLQSARTNGVFQVESQGMKDLLLRLQPTSLEDVSAILALYRPDSMAMLEDYIYYKHHPDEITYWHPDMIPLLEKTYGCIIYQEEIMDIVRVVGGRTYGGADKFRKGIGKKDKNLVKQEADKLYSEILKNGYLEELAKKISEYMSTMGGYSFNKSHSALYAILTMKTAYLKAHYPAHFFCALLNQNKNDYGVINKYIIDAKEFGVEILPPHINKSARGFTVHDEKILFGLEAIKGVGEKFVDEILDKRQEGKFSNYKDFLERVSPQKAQIISLVKAGAIPCKDKKQFLIRYAKELFENRPYTDVTTLPKLSILQEKYGIDTSIIKGKEARLKLYNQQRSVEHRKFQEEKFKKHMSDFFEKYLQNEEFWEFDALSIFITNNPFEEAYRYISQSFDEVPDNSEGVTVGVIANVTKKKDRKGKQFAFISIYSVFGLLEITCWHTQLKQYEDLIKRGNQVAIMFNKKDNKATIKLMKTYQQWLVDRKLR